MWLRSGRTGPDPENKFAHIMQQWAAIEGECMLADVMYAIAVVAKMMVGVVERNP